MVMKMISNISVFTTCLLAMAIASPVFADSPSRQSQPCAITSEWREVRGKSMTPLIEAGDTVELQIGYYDCYAGKRDDLVAYKYASRETPLLKFIKAIPGDHWELKEQDDTTNQIFVNGRALTNSQGQRYAIPASKSKMLELYTKSYPEIPDDTYLLLGNNTRGSRDATQFGLIDKSDILAAVNINTGVAAAPKAYVDALGSTGQHDYYHTSASTYTGSTADTACAAGYHQCGLIEWWGRRYDDSNGDHWDNAAWYDSGTGWSSNQISDCENWTNATTGAAGMTVNLLLDTPGVYEPLEVICSTSRKVLCCSD